MLRCNPLRTCGLGAALSLLAGLAARAAAPPTIQRINVTSTGIQATADSIGPLALSNAGRYVAFTTASDTFYGGLDTNQANDVYVLDRQTGFIQLVSRADSRTGRNQIANGASGQPSISSDGQFVAFQSDASNLVFSLNATGQATALDTNNLSDVFVRDRRGKTLRVSVGPGGLQATGGGSSNPRISTNGRFVVYTSDATNLVTGDANTVGDVFVTELQNDPFLGLNVVGTTRVSEAADGTEADAASGAASVSSDGRYVVFQSDATNLVTGDTNGKTDIFVKDLQTGAVTLMSSATDGTASNDNAILPDISADGRFISFVSAATNLGQNDANGKLDVFLHDRDPDGNGIFDEAGTGTTSTERISIATDGAEGDEDSGASTTPPASRRPIISSDGRFVLFESRATNLVSGDLNGMADLFIRDRSLNTTTRLSSGITGEEGNADSQIGGISGDGTTVAFISQASNLVQGDTNGFSDVFLVGTGGTSGGGGGGGSNGAPIANAGPDQTVREGDLVTLTGSGSVDPNGDILTYSWTQTGGLSQVTLNGASTANPTFTAPAVSSFDILQFQLTVSDGVNAPVTDAVSINVNASIPATLTGQVRSGSSTGPGVRGARVHVVRGDGQAATDAITDSTGRFTIRDVRVGQNTITVSAPGAEPRTSTLNFTSGQTVTQDFVLTVGTTGVSGSILLANGARLTGATVELLDSTGAVAASTTTGGTGTYRFANLTQSLVNGGVTLRIRGGGLSTWTVPLSLTANAQNLRNYRFGTLRLTVDTRPRNLRRRLNGTTIQLLVNGQPIATRTASRSARVLTFTNIPATSVQIQATNPNLTAAQTSVTAAPGAAVTQATIRLTRRGSGPF